MHLSLNKSAVGDGWWLGALFVVGLVPRMALIGANASSLEPWEYDTLAQNIAAGHGYVIARFGHNDVAFGDGNVYTFLSAVVYLAVGYRRVVLAVVQALIASLAAPVIFVIGRRVFDVRVAVFGALLAALHPGLLAYSVKLHPLGIDVLLLALSLLWVRRLDDRPRSWWMAGFAMGVTLMSRPTFFLAMVTALGVRWLSALRQRSDGLRVMRRLAPLVVTVIIALVIVSPWLLRNWTMLGRPIFISSSLEDIWKGNNPLASGSSYLVSGQDVFSAAPANLQGRLQQADELQRNDVYASQIVDFVSQRPSDFAALTAQKFMYFWWFSPLAGLLYPPAWLAAYELYFAVAMAFALVGVVAIVRRGNSSERVLLWTLLAMALTLATIHALSYVEGRHRWGIEPLLLLLTARGIFVVVDSVRYGRLLHLGQPS